MRVGEVNFRAVIFARAAAHITRFEIACRGDVEDIIGTNGRWHDELKTDGSGEKPGCWAREWRSGLNYGKDLGPQAVNEYRGRMRNPHMA